MATRTTGPADPQPRADGAGPLSAWLAPALVDWLHAKGCTGLTLLERDEDGDDAVEWRDAPMPGWRVPLGDGRGSGVLLAFAARDALGARELDDVAALFARLHAFPLVHDTSGAVLVDHAEVRHLIHDLRNCLNTLLINASLLTRAAAGIASLQRSAEFVDNAGNACSAHIERLSEITSRPRGRQ
jgi:hypothetical protein